MRYIAPIAYSLLGAILAASFSIADGSFETSSDLCMLDWPDNTTKTINESRYCRSPIQDGQLPDPPCWKGDGFYDLQGRRMYFRGVNVAGNAKLPPFIPFQDPRWWDLLASWGFNMVRLTVFWEAIEPEPGVYDREYLARVKEMADQASRRGIYVLMDMHQDIYSRWLGGDGAPAWALPEGSRKNSNFTGRLWFMAYILSGDVRAANANFFKSGYLREHYKNAWKEVAMMVKDNPYILGYDIMNEPSGGDLPNDAGQFENIYLKPFYQESLDAIREAHVDAVGFVEPHVLDMYGSKLTSFQDRRLVYAPHLYSPISISMLISKGEDPKFEPLLKRHIEKARELGMPLFIGEFGTPWTIQPSYKRDALVDLAMEAMESKFVDSAYWDYSVQDVDVWNGEDFSLIDENGDPRGLEVNVRPYLRRLNGTALDQHFDSLNRTYSLSINCSPDPAPAIIFIPEGVHYTGGFQAQASDGSYEYHPEESELWYFPGRDGCHNITLTPKPL